MGHRIQLSFGGGGTECISAVFRKMNVPQIAQMFQGKVMYCLTPIYAFTFLYSEYVNGGN